MSDLKINNITDRTGDSGPVIAGVSTVSTTGSFVVPVGATEFRGGRGRGVFNIGETSPTYVNSLNYITIATTGNSQDFGDLSTALAVSQNGSNSTRGVFAAGYSHPSNRTTIDYVTMSSKGGASDFGDAARPVRYADTVSDSTRIVWSGGFDTGFPGVILTDMEYITTATTGNSSRFGDLRTKNWLGSAAASPTRGVLMGGRNQPSSPESKKIVYITTQSKGQDEDFGELTVGRSYIAGGMLCSTTRGICAGGYDGSSPNNTIDYVTIATKGNATDFGDTVATVRATGNMSSLTRGVMSQGATPSIVNTLQYVTIATTGNATDFGDSTAAAGWNGGVSDSHGGLG
jgi:hypothetical protein